MAARKNSRRKSTKKTSKRSPRKRSSSNRARKKETFYSGLSLDRKLDLAGWVLLLVSLVTFLSLISASRGSLTNYWLDLLQKAFGWGNFLFPLVLAVTGGWLILRNFERIPTPAGERLVGMFLLFINILILLHLLTFTESSEAAYELARMGKGGGFIGATIMVLLREGLGSWGMGILLAAWMLMALALTLDVAVLDLFRWLPPLILRVQDWWDEIQAARQQQIQEAQTSPWEATPPATPASQAATAQAPEAHVAPAAGAPKGVGATAGAQRDFEEMSQRAWELPNIVDMLDKGTTVSYDDAFDTERARVIEETLSSFGAPANVVEINRGPVITQFGVEPAFIESNRGRTRVRVGKIAALADDLALALAASRIRIQAPVPGKGYVGIEVPNEEIALVALRNVIESQAFKRLKSPLRFALGQDVAGNAVAADLAAMPHLLIAGATGSGKSVCVNALISCLLLHNTPATLRMIMVDPKRVELTGYNGIPHLLAPVVVELDRVVGVLQWVTREMDNRYQKFADIGARNIGDYNNQIALQGGTQMPYLVVLIDELADLMMVAPDQTERLVTRMAQLARATGIHLVISTQRPSVDVVTGLIKANVPARIAFATASGTDSRVILDQPGAERLLGSGDMLFQAPDAPAPVRLQGVYLAESEILRLVQYWRAFAGTAASQPTASGARPTDAPPAGVPLKQMPIWEQAEEEPEDILYGEALDLVRRQGRASISMLQRRLRIGYTRAARLIETMEEKGIIGQPEGGAHHREILDWGDVGPPVED